MEGPGLRTLHLTQVQAGGMASRLYSSHATGNGRSARSGEGGQWTVIINGDVVVIVDLGVRSGPEIDWRLPDYKKL